MTVKGWTQEREARARKLWKEGYSATAIARDLNCGMSRNAVIGKLSRMGLVGAGSSRSRPSAPVQKAAAPSCPDAVPPTAANVSIAASARRGRPAGRPQNARTVSKRSSGASAPSGGPPGPAGVRPLGGDAAGAVAPDASAGDASRKRDRAPAASARTDAPEGAEDKASLPVPLEALRAGQCKWPVTSPAPGQPHLFCGARAIPGKPYCAVHHTRAYQARPKHADPAAAGPQGRKGDRPPALVRGTDSPDGLDAFEAWRRELAERRAGAPGRSPASATARPQRSENRPGGREGAHAT